MNLVYLVRHGENPANLLKQFSYRKVDYPLTEKGVLQAEQTAAYDQQPDDKNSRQKIEPPLGARGRRFCCHVDTRPEKNELTDARFARPSRPPGRLACCARCQASVLLFLAGICLASLHFG